jgi:alpha-N-arabinofuranosidase
MSLEKVAGLGAKRIRGIANAHRRYRETMDSLKGKDIRIAMDEWNHSRIPHYYGEIGCRFYFQDALGIAECLHEFYRQSDIIFMANYAQTVNVLGCIKTSRTSAEFATTGLPLKIYRHHFGEIPVEVTGKAEPLDVAAAWTKDQKELTIGIVNPTENKYELAVDLKNAQLTGTGYRWLISGPGRMAYNAPGQEPPVTIEEKAVSEITNKLSVPPLSINLYRLAVR